MGSAVMSSRLVFVGSFRSSGPVSMGIEASVFALSKAFLRGPFRLLSFRETRRGGVFGFAAVCLVGEPAGILLCATVWDPSDRARRLLRPKGHRAMLECIGYGLVRLGMGVLSQEVPRPVAKTRSNRSMNG